MNELRIIFGKLFTQAWLRGDYECAKLYLAMGKVYDYQ
jgi:hypothetical protein